MPKLPLEHIISLIAENIFSDDTASLLLQKNTNTTFLKTRLLTGCSGRIHHILRRRIPKKPSIRHERWVNKYQENEFRTLFRMCPKTFENLISFLKHEGVLTQSKWVQGQEPLSVEKKTLIALMYLGHETTFKDIGEKFSVRSSTVYKCVDIVISAICEVGGKFIVWPNYNKCVSISNGFQVRFGFPDVIGVVGTSHIAARIPSTLQEEYMNKADSYSVILQGVCDYEQLFTNVFIGYSGKSNSATVLKHSSIQKRTNEEGVESFFHGKFHLLGGSEYPLKQWLMVPFQERDIPEELDEFCSMYNVRLSLTRDIITDTFSLLKKRWKRLGYVNVLAIDKVSRVILASCVLHNFCLINKDFVEDILEVENQEFYELKTENFCDENLPNEASDKRMDIAEQFFLITDDE